MTYRYDPNHCPICKEPGSFADFLPASRSLNGSGCPSNNMRNKINESTRAPQPKSPDMFADPPRLRRSPPAGRPAKMIQRTGKLDPQRSGVVSFFDFGRFISYPINSCRSHNLPVTPAAIPGVTLKVLEASRNCNA
jgi:hypothetical protein